MSVIKKIILWFLTVFFAAAALVYIPGVAGFIFLLTAIMFLPIKHWQNILNRLISGKLRVIVTVALVFMTFLTVPAPESTESNSSLPDSAPIIEVDNGSVPTQNEVSVPGFTADSIDSASELPDVNPSTAEKPAPEEPPVEEAVIEEPTVQVPVIEDPTLEETALPSLPTAVTPPEDNGHDYVLNTNTRKFHYPSCSSVPNIKPANRADFHGTRDEAIAKGYDSCGRCHP